MEPSDAHININKFNKSAIIRLRHSQEILPHELHRSCLMNPPTEGTAFAILSDNPPR